MGKILVLLDSPTEFLFVKKLFLNGEEQRVIDNTLKALKISPKTDVIYHWAISTPLIKNKAKLGQINKAHSDLMEWLVTQDISKIFVLGGVALSVLLNKEYGDPTKTRGLGYRVINPLNEKEYYCVQSIPLWQVLKVPDYFRDFTQDLEKLLKYHQPFNRPKVDCWLTESPKELQEALDSLKYINTISVDTETTGFRSKVDKLEAIGLCYETHLNEYDISCKCIVIPKTIIYLDETKTILKEFFSNKEKRFVFHNAKFDLQFLTWYLDYDFIENTIDDTMLINYLLDERPIGKDSEGYAGTTYHSLKALARIWFDQDDYHFSFETFYAKEEDKRDYMTLYSYLCLDVLWTRLLYYELASKVTEESEKLWDVYNTLLIPGTKVLVGMELGGLLLDTQYLEKLKVEMTDQVDDILIDLKTIIKNKINSLNGNLPYFLVEYEDNLIAKYSKKKEYKNNPELLKNTLAGIPKWDDLFNPGSYVQVGNVIYELFGVRGVEGTGSNVLLHIKKHFKNELPDLVHFIDTLLKYRGQKILLNTFVIGMLNKVDENGYIHPSFLINGTITGRLSSQGPNAQNIPGGKESPIRKAFIAPDGYSFINGDFSQLELRVVGSLSNDDLMIYNYENNLDIHRQVASASFNKPEEEITYDERRTAKTISFGVLYQMGPDSLANSDALMDFDYSKEQAQEFIDRFLGQYQQLSKWLTDIKKETFKNQQVTSLIGRIRRFPLITKEISGAVSRQGINFLVQSLASDLCLYSLIKLNKELPKIGARLCLNVHDSIACYCPNDKIDEAVALFKDCMINNPLVELKLPLGIEIEIGKNWGEAHKI